MQVDPEVAQVMRAIPGVLKGALRTLVVMAVLGATAGVLAGVVCYALDPQAEQLQQFRDDVVRGAVMGAVFLGPVGLYFWGLALAMRFVRDVIDKARGYQRRGIPRPARRRHLLVSTLIGGNVGAMLGYVAGTAMTGGISSLASPSDDAIALGLIGALAGVAAGVVFTLKVRAARGDEAS